MAGSPDNRSSWGKLLLDAISDGSISLGEGIFMAESLGMDLDYLTMYAESLYASEEIDANRYTKWINALYDKYTGG